MRNIPLKVVQKLFFVENNNVTSLYYNQPDETPQNQQRRDYGIDLIRFIAIIFVITIHCCDKYFQNYTSNYWLLGNIFKSISRSGVELFILISGYLLLKKNIYMPSFYLHRLHRILVPFIFFSIIYYLHSDLEFYSVYNFINKFMHGNIYYHLWFLYPMIGLYICLPYIQKMLFALNNREIKFFLIIFLLMYGCYPVIHSILFKYTSSFTQSFGLFLFGQFSGFAIFGYLLRNIIVNKLLLFVLYITATILYIAETTWVSNKITAPFEDPHNIFVSLQAFSIFIFCKNYNFIKFKIVSEISKYSFGIYLIHMLILPYCLKFINKFDAVIHPLGVMIFLILSTLGISYYSIKYLCKTRYIKNFVN